MAENKLEPSLLRDVLATLTEATREGEWTSIHKLAERTGMGYVAARGKLEQLSERGLVERRLGPGGVAEYQATAQAEELL